MEMNLRKARKLESSIQNYLDENETIVTASIRSLGSLEDALSSMSSKKLETLKNLENRKKLLEVRYEIRRQIEKTNEDSSINNLINKKVLCEKLAKEFDSFQSFEKPSELELQDQIIANKNALTSESGSRRSIGSIPTTFNVNIFSKEDLDSFKDQKISLKKELEDLEDSINQRNLSNKVVLSEDAVKLLKAVRLL